MDAEHQRRVAANAVATRAHNAEIHRALTDAPGRQADDRTHGFRCECPVSECVATIDLTVPQYEHVRSRSAWFVVKPDHVLRGAAEPVEKFGTYWIVETIDAARAVAETANDQPRAGSDHRSDADVHPSERPAGTTPIAGDRIVALRRAASMSQPELAARAGVSISSVYRAERGDPSIGPRTIARIAAALAVDPGEIHSGDVLLRAGLPLPAHRAEEQHEEVMRVLKDIQERIERG